MSEEQWWETPEGRARKLAEAKRAAFEAGASYNEDISSGQPVRPERWMAEARRRYPIRVTRRREVQDPHIRGMYWRATDDEDGGVERLHYRRPRDIESAAVYRGVSRVTPERVRLWADLIDHPDETVEE